MPVYLSVTNTTSRNSFGEPFFPLGTEHRTGLRNRQSLKIERLERESTSNATALSSQQKGPRKQKGRTHRQPTAKG